MVFLGEAGGRVCGTGELQGVFRFLEPIYDLRDSGDPALKFVKNMRVDSSPTAFFSEFRLG
jgi:hypothetical protein